MCGRMVRTISKSLIMGLDVARELEQEENQSKVVDQLLRDHYDLPDREDA